MIFGTIKIIQKLNIEHLMMEVAGILNKDRNTKRNHFPSNL